MRKFLLSLGIALAAIGCAKDADVSPSGDNPLIITSNIATRVANSSWEKSDAIGVYLDFTNDGGTDSENVKYTTENGDGIFTSENPLYITSGVDAQIRAYYPYYAFDGEATFNTYPIDSEDQVDLLWAIEEDITDTSSPVDLAFDHLLSKVSITIEAGAGVTLQSLTSLVVELSGISTTAKVNLDDTDDDTKVTPTNQDKTLELETTIIEDGEGTMTAVSSSAIVIPQSLSGAELSFTNDGKTFTATLSTETFEVGKEYTYTATLCDDKVEITESNIASWGSGDSAKGTANFLDIEYKDEKYYINSAKGLAAFSDLVCGAGNTNDVTFAGFESSTFNSANTAIDGVLTRNINLEEVCYADLKWNPIGRNYNSTLCSYVGKFDGGGYEVSKLYINATSQQALFGYVGDGGAVYNLGVSGEVTAAYTGGKVYQTAGIVANNSGFVINCYSKVNVTGEINVGGIVGHNDSTGSVVNCYNWGSVEGKDVDGYANNVGGIVGQNGATGYVGYCYSTGSVSLSQTQETTERIGGVVGYNITESESSPQVKGSFCLNNTQYSIGQVGENASSEGIDGNVCTQEYLESESFVTTINNGADLYNDTVSNYDDDDDEDTKKPPVAACLWVHNSDGGYPTLDIKREATETALDISYNSISYNIYNYNGLLAFAALVNGTAMPTGVITSGDDIYFQFKTDGYDYFDIDGNLMDNITIDSSTWTPIGSSSEDPYSGLFEGNSKTISGVSVLISESDNSGVFRYVSSEGNITNVTVSN